MKPVGRLLLVEMVLPDDDTPHPGQVFDIIMLVLNGGQERTVSEYSALLSKVSFHMTRVTPITSAASVIEAVPV